MDQVARNFLVLAIAGSFAFCQELPVNYSARSIAEARVGMCPSTQSVIETIRQDMDSLINNSVLSTLTAGSGYGDCGCGDFGWRRVAYLNMSDPTQTCPPAWELITTPRRSCGRPSNAGNRTCNSAMFPTQGIQYSEICSRIIGYQVGEPGAFSFPHLWPTIDDPYVDGVSLTHGSPHHHIWTFAGALHKYPLYYTHNCPCTNVTEQRPIAG